MTDKELRDSAAPELEVVAAIAAALAAVASRSVPLRPRRTVQDRRSPWKLAGRQRALG